MMMNSYLLSRTFPAGRFEAPDAAPTLANRPISGESKYFGAAKIWV
jgi:hypothetical protein